MSTQLRASVRRLPTGEWTARVALTGPDASPDQSALAFAPTHPEAMQRAWLLLAQMHQELMDAVHASRATRRATRYDGTERCERCQFGDMRYGHRYTADCNYRTPAPTTMEPTA